MLSTQTKMEGGEGGSHITENVLLITHHLLTTWPRDFTDFSLFLPITRPENVFFWFASAHHSTS